jgi:hypothetical protein
MMPVPISQEAASTAALTVSAARDPAVETARSTSSRNCE